MPSQGFLCQCPVVPGALILHLGIKEVFFSHKSNPGYPGFHNLHRFRAPGPLQFSEHRHSDSGEYANKSARHSPQSERLEQAKGTHYQELSMIWCSVVSTIKMIHWHLPVHRLFRAWLVSSQALSAGIAVPGRETQSSLRARLVLLAL